jgi:hypothetical protein
MNSEDSSLSLLLIVQIKAALLRMKTESFAGDVLGSRTRNWHLVFLTRPASSPFVRNLKYLHTPGEGGAITQGKLPSTFQLHVYMQTNQVTMLHVTLAKF